MKNQLDCQSSTSYDKIWDYIEENTDKYCIIHYETKGFEAWHHDSYKEGFINNAFKAWLRGYMGTKHRYRTMNDAYIHNIEII